MTLAELRQKAAAIAMKMRSLHKEIGDKAWSDEQRSKWDQLQADHSNVEQQIQREEQMRGLDQKYADDNQEERKTPEGEDRSGGQNTDELHTRAFNGFMRRGFADLTQEERQALKEVRAQTVGTDADGGYTVPTQFLNKIVERMKAYGGIASVAQVLNTQNGQDIQWATSDGTNDMGSIVGEGGEATEKDVSFGQATLGAIKLTSGVIKASNELLQDTAVDLEAFLSGRIARRIGRKEAQLIVQGSGLGTPKQNKGLASSVTLSQTAAAAAAISYTDLINLKHKVDPAYRNGPKVRYAFNDGTFKAVKLLKDLQGRPLWLPAIHGVAPSTIDGDQFVIDQAIADLGASAKSAYYGDFDALILRRVAYMTLKRLVEKYAEYDMTGFVAFHRFDTCLEDTAAIAVLENAAS